MAVPSPALTALRSATAAHHEGLEARLGINRVDAGREEYLAYARALYGWLRAHEPHLWAAPWPPGFDVETRANKWRWLEEDLRAAGLSDAELEALPRPPVSVGLSSQAERFGAAYVIEGAQLGGQVLSRRLGPKLAPWQLRWLQGYGSATGAMWSSFLSALAEHVTEPTDLDRAAHSAQGTFSALSDWFQAQGAA